MCEDTPELHHFLANGGNTNTNQRQSTMAAPTSSDSPEVINSYLNLIFLVEYWEEYFDPNSGAPYYRNTVTGVTQWAKPDCLKSEEELGKSGDWVWAPHEVNHSRNCV